VVPKGLRGSGLNHLSRHALFQLTDAAFCGIHPWWVRFGLSFMAVVLSEFVAKLALGLFLGTVHDHNGRNTILLEQ
jgi:hypothetical protein